jgi:hypothetical protein
MLANATNFYRKSGAAQWRDLCVDAPSWKCFFDRSVAQWRDLLFSLDSPRRRQTLARFTQKPFRRILN